MDQAEILVLKVVQQGSFAKDDQRLKTLDVFRDDSGILRLKSRIANRKDTVFFRMPIVLPSRHVVTKRLVFDSHRRSCHVGAQGLGSLLREKYWILGGRSYIKSIISKCVVCRRQIVKGVQVQSPPLPADRVNDASAFQITGVDFAGPLHLRTGEKVWICIFTCAIYRAVHLEIASSLSTELEWREVERFAKNIAWRFNPPTAAWWGGFWERLIGILKGLLRKVLGRAALNYEDLLTVVCDFLTSDIYILDSRPLTYISEDESELVPLTHVMFTRDLSEDTLPECDFVARSSLCRRVKRMQKIRDNLRLRFRNEYFGQLRNIARVKSPRQIKIGEVVLVGNDNTKRMDWPLGRTTKVLPGKDGAVCLVRVSTTNGVMLRPVQRVYALEETGVPADIRNSEAQTAPSEATRTIQKSSAIGSVKSRALDSKTSDFSDEEASDVSFPVNGSDQSRVPAVPKITRQIVKGVQVQSPPLPADRVNDASAFQITGVDSLYLASLDREKVGLFFHVCHFMELSTLEIARSLFLMLYHKFKKFCQN
ncbi:uncharacterized protein LOC115886978 [Sitophilus oryzae]|uniref:Uncharacterized protein LOC115886978 n=1 Tax=Sitophilus oryzae TaxID=7048 RepID=A0A6J2YH00_SITOR|nr:uncharacterized protein LOC115886978 [Sitophilus oryzae]